MTISCIYDFMLAIASKFSRLASQAVGDLRVDLHQKAENARAQAKELERLARREGSTPTPYAGGISQSDKEIDRDDSDIVQPVFSRGQFTNTRQGAKTALTQFGVGADS